MNYLSFALSYLGLAAVTYLGCHLLIVISHRHNLLDPVSTRSSHLKPTPRIGGLAFSLTMAGALTYICLTTTNFFSPTYWLALICCPLIVTAISLIDDLSFSISRKIRIVFHALASCFAVWLLGWMQSDWYAIMLAAILVISMVWFINLFNFMDGIDGIAASEALFIITTSAGFSVYTGHMEWAYLQLLIGAPLVGFLVINWQPAKIFMGDVGSTYLGAIIPVILLINITLGIFNMWMSIIICSAFMIDASWTLMVRVVSKQTWYKPHRSHLYQILSRKFASHARVSLCYTAYNALWLLPLSIFSMISTEFAHFFTLLAIIPMAMLCIMHRAGFASSN